MEQSLANLNPSIHMADPLVFREPNGSVKPHIATAWSYPDDKTLRFKVRKDVKFHTGDLMTTEDIAFTYNLLLDPKTDSRHTPALRAIGEVKAVDAETVDFVLKEPDATLLGRLSILPVMPKKYFESVGGVDAVRPEAGRHRAVQVRRVGQGPARQDGGEPGLLPRPAEDQDDRLPPDLRGQHPHHRAADRQRRPRQQRPAVARPEDQERRQDRAPDRPWPAQRLPEDQHQEGAVHRPEGPAGLEPRHRRQADHRDGPGRQRRRHARRLRGPRRLGLLQGHRQRGVPVRPEQGEGAPRRGRRQARPDQHPLGEGPAPQRRRGRPGHRRACSRTSASRLK